MAGAKAPVKWLLGTLLTLPISEISYDCISISLAARDPRTSIYTDKHPSDQAKRSEFCSTNNGKLRSFASSGWVI